MKFNTEMESVNAETKENILVISSSKPLTVLSSAVLNGGLVKADAVINVQVPEGSGEDKTDLHWNTETFLKTQIKKLHLSSGTVCLMTAAKMKNVAAATRKCEGTALALCVTAGTTVAVTAGEPAASKTAPKPGTINIILLVDSDMTDGCMVEAHKTITEAKTVALRELDVRSQFSGDLASGTLTDSVAVACTKRGEFISYAGTFTLIGETIAQCVRQCVKEAIYKQENFGSNRPLQKRLAERGIQPEDVLSLSEAEASKVTQLKTELGKTLADEKISQLVLACLRFDDDLSKGLIPKAEATTVDQATFEKIVTTTVRDYLSEGKNPSACGRLKLKLRNEENLGPLTTCLLNAILKSIQAKSE